MKINEITKKLPIIEDASAGATGSSAVATNLGGGAGFGKSIFMRRTSKSEKKTKRTK
jgi:hypothetical protein